MKPNLIFIHKKYFQLMFIGQMAWLQKKLVSLNLLDNFTTLQIAAAQVINLKKQFVKICRILTVTRMNLRTASLVKTQNDLMNYFKAGKRHIKRILLLSVTLKLCENC